jgi:hypothetical protein
MLPEQPAARQGASDHAEEALPSHVPAVTPPGEDALRSRQRPSASVNARVAASKEKACVCPAEEPQARTDRVGEAAA